MAIPDNRGKLLYFEMPDLMAVMIKIGEAILMFAPFVIFGAVLSTALETILRRPLGQWRGHHLTGIIATFPVGLAAMLGALVRSTISRPETVSDNGRSSILGRALSQIDDLIFPYLLSAVVGGIIAILAPTEPLWSLLSPSAPWRFLVAPLLVGLLRARGGSELPLVVALITKGLDPAGAAAAVAGAAWLRAGSFSEGVKHIGIAAVLGMGVSLIPLEIW